MKLTDISQSIREVYTKHNIDRSILITLTKDPNNNFLVKNLLQSLPTKERKILLLDIIYDEIPIFIFDEEEQEYVTEYTQGNLIDYISSQMKKGFNYTCQFLLLEEALKRYLDIKCDIDKDYCIDYMDVIIRNRKFDPFMNSDSAKLLLKCISLI